MNAQVESFKHIDVRGKELLYLRIKTNKGEALINIGAKTHEHITKITKEEEAKTIKK